MAGFEFGAGGEGWAVELESGCQYGGFCIVFLCQVDSKTYVSWAGAAAVDEGVDGGGVVDEVHGDGGVGELVAVLGDEVLEVGRDLLGLGVAHALAGAAEVLVAQLGLGGSEDGGREGRGGEDVGAHFCWGLNGLFCFFGVGVYGENIKYVLGLTNKRVYG